MVFSLFWFYGFYVAFEYALNIDISGGYNYLKVDNYNKWRMNHGESRINKIFKNDSRDRTTIYSAKRLLNKIDSISVTYEKPIAPVMPKLEDVDHFEVSNVNGAVYIFLIILGLISFICCIFLSTIGNWIIGIVSFFSVLPLF